MAALLTVAERNIENALFVIPAVLIGWYIVSSILTWHRLRHIPGPFLASFSYTWLGYISFNGKVDEAYLYLDEKYGKLVRVGPNELLTSDPELIRKMGSIKSGYSKGAWHDGDRFNPYHPTMFIMRDAQRHDSMKARLTPGYGGRDIPGYEAAVDEQVNNLVSLIRRKYLSAPEMGIFRDFDFTRPLMYFPLDVIFSLSVSKHTGGEAGCSEMDDEPYGLYSALEDQLPQIALTTDNPYIRNIVFSSTFLRWFGPKETDSTGMGALMKRV